MKYTLPEIDRKRRRALTAAMNRCSCGNIVRLGEKRCGRCKDRYEEEEIQRKRNEWIDQQMGATK